MPDPTTGDRFDPTDPAFLQDPYPTYARMRRVARLELEVAIGALLRRFPDLRLLGPEATYVPKNVFRYLTALRVPY